MKQRFIIVNAQLTGFILIVRNVLLLLSVNIAKPMFWNRRNTNDDIESVIRRKCVPIGISMEKPMLLRGQLTGVSIVKLMLLKWLLTSANIGKLMLPGNLRQTVSIMRSTAQRG